MFERSLSAKPISMSCGLRPQAGAFAPRIIKNKCLRMQAFDALFFRSLRLKDNFIFLVAMRLGGTPVNIPNTMVKTQAADSTRLETAREDRWLPNTHGGIAQLGEHLPCKQGVKGSNPFISTDRFSGHGTLKTSYR